MLHDKTKTRIRKPLFFDFNYLLHSGKNISPFVIYKLKMLSTPGLFPCSKFQIFVNILQHALPYNHQVAESTIAIREVKPRSGDGERKMWILQQLATLSSRSRLLSPPNPQPPSLACRVRPWYHFHPCKSAFTQPHETFFLKSPQSWFSRKLCVRQSLHEWCKPKVAKWEKKGSKGETLLEWWCGEFYRPSP